MAEQNPDSACIRAVNATMRRKLSLLHEIHKLTVAEYGYVRDDSIEQLGNVLAEKQELMNEIDALDNRFLREFTAMKEAFGVSSVEEMPAEADADGSLAQMKSSTADILDALAKISDLDAQITEKISELRQALTADMTRLRHQRHVSGIYGADVRQQDAQQQRQGPLQRQQTQQRPQAQTQARGGLGSTFDKKK